MMRAQIPVIALVMLTLSHNVWSQEAGGFPPITHSGFLGYDYGFTDGGDSGRSSHALMVNWGVASYIKQPYIAQYFASLTLRQSLSTGSGEDAKNLGVLGNLNLRLFPQSHFPAELYWLEEDQGTQQGESDVTTSRRAVGLIQRYTSRRRLSTRLHLEHVNQAFDDRVEAGSQFGRNSIANLLMSMPLGRWNLSWDNLYRKDVNEAAGYRRDRWLSNLRYHWAPSHEVTLSGFATYQDARIERTNRMTSGQKRGDLSGYLTWRPASERPLTVTSTFRHTELLGGEGEANATGGLTSLLGAANYRLTDQFSLLASANTAYQRSDQTDIMTSGALAEGRYSSGGHRLGPFNYNWNTSAGGRWDRQEDEYGDVFSGVARFGHGMDTGFPLGGASITTRLSQYMSAIRGSDGESSQSVSNTASVRYNRRSAIGNSFVTLSLTDTAVRGGGGRAGDLGSKTRFATLLYTQQNDLTQDSRLSGSVSIQISRSDRLGEGWREVGPSGSADLTYQNRMFLRVPLLTFRSTLRWSSSDFISSADDPGEAPGTERLYWDNRLDYRIGLLEARLLLRFSQVNGEGRNLVYLSLRRYFGGRLN